MPRGRCICDRLTQNSAWLLTYLHVQLCVQRIRPMTQYPARASLNKAGASRDVASAAWPAFREFACLYWVTAHVSLDAN